MTIVIVSVTITTVTVKNYYRDSGHVVSGMCIWHCPVSTHPQPHEKHAKMVRNISDEIDPDKELEAFLLEGSKEWCTGVLSFSATGGKCSETISKFYFHYRDSIHCRDSIY